MAGSQKKRLVAENQTNAVQQTVVQAEFEGRNPEFEDYYGIKRLLQQLFLKGHIDIAHFSDLIINQKGLGSVLKQSFDDNDMEETDDDLVDESEVFGVCTVVNLDKERDLPAVHGFISYICEMADKHYKGSDIEKIKNILSNLSVGFLINERFVNIPAKIADPLLSSLEKELKSFSNRDPYYQFDYYIMICKTYKNEKDGEEFFSNEEESIFCKESDINFEYSVAADSDTGLGGKWKEDDVEMTPYRKVLFIKADKLSPIISAVKQFVA